MKKVQRTTKTIPCTDINLHRKLKKTAADEGIPMQQLVDELLTAGLEMRKNVA